MNKLTLIHIDGIVPLQCNNKLNEYHIYFTYQDGRSKRRSALRVERVDNNLRVWAADIRVGKNHFTYSAILSYVSDSIGFGFTDIDFYLTSRPDLKINLMVESVLNKVFILTGISEQSGRAV